MSIFSSIGNAVKSAATGVYNTVNKIGSGIASAFGGSSGVSNTANALQGTYIPGSYTGLGQNTANDKRVAGISAGGASGSWTTPTTPVSYTSLMTPTPSGSNYTATGGTSSPSYSTIGGGSYGTYTAPPPVSMKINASNIGIGNPLSQSSGAIASSGGSIGGVGGSPAYQGTQSSLAANNIALGLNADGTKKVTPETVGNPISLDSKIKETANKTLDDFLKEAQATQPTLPSADLLRTQANNEAGVMNAQLQRNNTQNQINAITAKMNADLLSVEGQGRGIPLAVIGGQQEQITKEATVRLLPLQAQLAADQGNLELAKETANDLFKYRYQDATAKADQWYKTYEIAKDSFTAAEKKKADQIKLAHDNNKSELDRNFGLMKSAYDTAIDSGQTSLASKILSVINSTPSVDSANFKTDMNQVMNNFNQYSSQIVSLKSKLDNSQLNNSLLTGEKLKNEVDQTKPASGEYAGVINAVSGLVGAAKAPAVKNAISTALSKNDYTTAYSNIANAVEDSLTGSNKTKFADSRTDIGVMQGMRNAIKAYTDAGGDLGYLKGTADTIAKKFGQLATDPKFAALGVQLQREFQAYRLSMTGAAFSPAESKDYASVNPRTDASLDLNLATIDGALNQLTNRVSSTINQRIPDAQKIYDKIVNNPTTPTTNQDSVDYRAKYNY